MNLRQYQIVIVNLDPTVGSEIKKTRPCLVISPDEMNKYLRTITIAPITGKSRNYPTRVKFSLQNQKSWIVLDQIRAIDKKRIHKNVSKLPETTIKKVKAILKEIFID